MAEHSFHCHDEAVRLKLPRDWRLLVLLHDAHEAYIGDIITPVAAALDVLVEEATGRSKEVHSALNMMRRRHDREILAAVGLDWNTLTGAAWFAMKGIDSAAMMTERDALAPVQPESWGDMERASRLPFTPQCWDAKTARREFLERVALYDPRALKVLADLNINLAA